MSTDQRAQHATGELRPKTWPPRLLRQEVPLYLLEKHGIRITTTWLNKAAVTGEGPAYSMPVNRALYALGDLDVWAAEKIGTPRRSTSEAA